MYTLCEGIVRGKISSALNLIMFNQVQNRFDVNVSSVWSCGSGPRAMRTRPEIIIYKRMALRRRIL